MELRGREEASAWVAAGLSLSRLANLAEAQGVASSWLIHSIGETGRIPPPGVVLDFGKLFAGHPLRRSVPLPPLPRSLKTALRSYEDHVLGRIEASSILDGMIDAFGPLSVEERAKAVAVVTARMLERLGADAMALSPGVVRQVVATATDDLSQFASTALSSSASTAEALAFGYRAITERAHRVGELITEADVFVVEHISALGDLTQRLAIGEIIETSAERRAALPRRIKARRRPKKRQVLTALSDEDHYPTGGFSSIATSGSMENLVISELIYMEDPEGAQQDAGVDLFDLRYAEGELLYYTRDDSQFVREHRAIGIALMPDLALARIKDRGAPRQRIVELLALVHCAIGRLAEWLSEQALAIAVATIDAGASDPLESERSLLEVLLAEEIERGLVTVGRQATLTEALESSVGDPRAETEWLVASTSPLTAAPAGSEQHCFLRLDGLEPRFAVGGQDYETLASWDGAVMALLHRMV